MLAPTVALSSCWNSQRHLDGYQMAREMAALGFSHIELSHGIRLTLVEGILRAVAEGVVHVLSCHNFCPLPAGITQAAPNLYVPSSRDHRERAMWQRHTRRSIDFAAQVGARVLVLHLGRIDFFWSNPADRLEKAAAGRDAATLAGDPRYQATREKALAQLRAKAPEYWAHVKASLREVLPHAAEKGVRLVFENREAFDELPLDPDFPELFAGLASHAAHCGYWHDTGHAQIKENMGATRHTDLLATNLERLAGFHLHDVANGRDHQQIGAGTVDWEKVRQFFRPHHLFVIEPSPRLTPEQVLASRAFLAGLFARPAGAVR